MAFLDGSPLIAVDIDLDNVPPATSVAEANSRFSDRAAAAILYAASLLISEGSTKLGKDYGTRILAKMAYADYFSGSDQVPGPITLRDEVNAAIEAEKAVGRVGSTIDFNKTLPPIHIHNTGDYDVLLTGYVKLYYRFFNVLSPKARENLFNTPLSLRGPYDPGEKIALEVDLSTLNEVPWNWLPATPNLPVIGSTTAEASAFAKPMADYGGHVVGPAYRTAHRCVD